MSQNFEQLLEDNYSLKKQLMLTRQQHEQLSHQLSELTLSHQQLLNSHTTLNQSYNHLQQTHQLQMNQHHKDINSLTSQLETLKSLIEQKQIQLEQFQLRMIPNLDQDMLRVQLIAEMEGPYQETVEKKDREIIKMKEQLARVQRKYAVIQMQLRSKENEFKREIDQTKSFYQSENNKLIKELSLLHNQKEVKDYSKETFKRQRKEIEELRCTIDLHSQNQHDFKKQMKSLKMEKQQLLDQIGRLNQKKALDLHLSSQHTQIRTLREQKKRLEDSLIHRDAEIEKLNNKYKKLEKQFKINQDESRRTFNLKNQNLHSENQALKMDLRKEKQETQRAKDKVEKLVDEIQSLKNNLRTLEKDLQQKRSQNDRIKSALEELEREYKRLQSQKHKKLSLSKDLIDESQKKENNNKKENIKQICNHTSTVELEKTIAKLKQKLEIANRKIVQLLKEKVSMSPQKGDLPRERRFSQIESTQPKPQRDRAFLLEYRDTSFIPLVPPTIFTRVGRDVRQ